MNHGGFCSRRRIDRSYRRSVAKVRKCLGTNWGLEVRRRLSYGSRLGSGCRLVHLVLILVVGVRYQSFVGSIMKIFSLLSYSIMAVVLQATFDAAKTRSFVT